MTMIEPPLPKTDRDLLTSPDADSRILSHTAVEGAFVKDVFGRIASVYDVFFGPALHPGRLRAIERMNVQPGERVLEVGVGTGINVVLYPPHCQVTGIDFSPSMLKKAHERIAKRGFTHVRLFEMDATAIDFPDDSFDIVFGPYLINVVPDPIQVAREMRRVCRPGGRIMFLNHFRSTNPVMSTVERLMTPLTVHAGFKVDLDLQALLAQTGLQATAIERVNIPKIWHLVTCVK
jgi:phosphatidylethanolamine/phosphatidyl-N-methylethanolamine N-methyltransferase